MIKNTLILFLLFTTCHAQLDFFKYSTFYGSISINTPPPSPESYIYNGQLIETTNEYDNNYRYAIGIKKIGRYKFEKKPKFYYDGQEKNATIYRSSLNKGFEYLFQYEKIKDRDLEFDNYDFWLRYIGQHFLTKIQYSNNGYIDLNYKSLDFRFKRDIKNIQTSFGLILRSHPIYGYNAFKNDYPDYDDFNTTIDALGYSPQSSWIDGNYNGYFDRWEQSITIWTNENGDTIANSTQEMQNLYGDIVGDYNRNWNEQQGGQNTLSTVVGLSYYNYLEKWFILIYGDILFNNYTSGDFDVSKYDYDFGFIANYKLTKSISLYSQINYLKYFDKENYSINLGINVLII